MVPSSLQGCYFGNKNRTGLYDEDKIMSSVES
mgnify:CR=1 FL=1